MRSIAPLHTTPVFKKNQPDDTYKFQPLPKPSGKHPYHLSLQAVKPQLSNQKMIFHLAGDTGGIYPEFQQLIADEMTKQYKTNGVKTDQPQFFYHLGDIVYHHGEAEHYYNQFFKPYRHYPGPVFAIAGNHDGDINPNQKTPYKSLDAFTTVFCDTVSRPVIFSGDSGRKSMIQPNVYWTLETPLANIIGLYSNVPKYGVITPEQRAWFIGELKAADKDRPDKALIICIHHAPYSADINHGASLPIIEFMENAFAETGIKPDIVFSGHVHNYQRFNKRYADGVSVPYIVAGAGGFDELHPLASIKNQQFTAKNPLFDQVQLKSYCDDKHGFLKIILERTTAGLILTGEYYTIPHLFKAQNDSTATLTDHFHLTIRK